MSGIGAIGGVGGSGGGDGMAAGTGPIMGSDTVTVTAGVGRGRWFDSSQVMDTQGATVRDRTVTYDRNHDFRIEFGGIDRDLRRRQPAGVPAQVAAAYAACRPGSR